MASISDTLTRGSDRRVRNILCVKVTSSTSLYSTQGASQPIGSTPPPGAGTQPIGSTPPTAGTQPIGKVGAAVGVSGTGVTLDISA
jgi:hypothetical protein